jgi:hypothetical protein
MHSSANVSEKVQKVIFKIKLANEAYEETNYIVAKRFMDGAIDYCVNEIPGENLKEVFEEIKHLNKQKFNQEIKIFLDECLNPNTALGRKIRQEVGTNINTKVGLLKQIFDELRSLSILSVSHFSKFGIPTGRDIEVFMKAAIDHDKTSNPADPESKYLHNIL